MPTYYNNNANYISDGGVLFPPLTYTRTLSYHYNNDLELTSHQPKVEPFKILVNGTIPEEAVHGMENFRELVVENNTGAELTITPNDEGEDGYVIADGDTRIFELNREWGRVIFTGSGTGTLRVTATK